MDCAIGCGVEVFFLIKVLDDGSCKNGNWIFLKKKGMDALPEYFTMTPEKEQKFSFGEFPYKLVHQGISAELIVNIFFNLYKRQKNTTLQKKKLISFHQKVMKKHLKQLKQDIIKVKFYQ